MKSIKKTNNSKYRLAIIASHPIQYQAPFFREINKCPEIDLKVFFCSEFGSKEYYDVGFSKNIRWDIPLLEGYSYEFLPNFSPRPNQSNFSGLINPTIIQKLKEGSFDAVWIHGWNSLTNILAMFTAFNLKIPVLLRSESNLLNEKATIKTNIKKNILSNIFKKVSGFLSIGKYNSDFYLSYSVPNEKIFLVPYTVDNDYFINKANELKPRKDKLKEKHGIPKDLPVILFSGKLIPQKRPMDLLIAYSKVIQTTKSVLIFVGDGILRNELENYVKVNNLKLVYFVGFKNQTEIPEFYALADVLALPSAYEPWGLVINEAMCFGLPVITSDKVGAAGDLVKEGENGFIYSCGDINSLSKLIQQLLTNNDLLISASKKSSEIIINWSFKQGLNGFLNCLEKSL